ncbi:hypothetical protein PCIT_b0909 [Pseudoalteromonas citrea]|uniref:DUF2141 domain-containing protein n=2 Tax=Pseudoalteromonas citrea TaxID=43655 RepID=A0AAD4AF47_9GAMM|nr:DUF2141 domain-containing protein [Pseudoalteromonas citrea]KAF7764826.1 hypothetical protein PCIT_b0909 [Pseudoalteromonas citrea]
MKNLTRFTTTAIVLTSMALSAQAAQLNINLQKVRVNQGTLKVAIYNSAQGMKKYQAFEVLEQKSNSESVTFSVADLDPGQYAVMVYQDLNGDGKLGRNLMGIPNEPYGFSNNPRLMGPPKFTQLAVNVNDTSISTDIELR